MTKKEFIKEIERRLYNKEKINECYIVTEYERVFCCQNCWYDFLEEEFTSTYLYECPWLSGYIDFDSLIPDLSADKIKYDYKDFLDLAEENEENWENFTFEGNCFKGE